MNVPTIETALDVLAAAWRGGAASIIANEDRLRASADQLAAFRFDPLQDFRLARYAGQLAVSCSALSDCGQAHREGDIDGAIAAIDAAAWWQDRARRFFDSQFAS